jgi:bacterial/archaeal transporter family protein
LRFLSRREFQADYISLTRIDGGIQMPDATHAQAGWQFFAFGSAFFAALTAIFGKVGVGEINSNLAVLIRTAVILAMTFAVVFVRKEFEPLGNLSRTGLLMLVLSAAATGLSWLCYYRALQLAPASYVAPVDKLSVALVVVLAATFLGEALTLKTIVGAALVTLGAVVLVKE